METALSMYKKNIKQHLINSYIESGAKNSFTPEQNTAIYMDEHNQRIEQEFESLRFITDIEYLTNKL